MSEMSFDSREMFFWLLEKVRTLDAKAEAQLVAARDYEGLDDVLLVAVTEKRTPAEIDRLAAVLAEVAR